MVDYGFYFFLLKVFDLHHYLIKNYINTTYLKKTCFDLSADTINLLIIYNKLNLELTCFSVEKI